MVDASSSHALQMLASEAERAGAAMACRYSCSDEFEAALIAERRRAGAYRDPRRHRVVLWGAAAAVALISILAVS